MVYVALNNDVPHHGEGTVVFQVGAVTYFHKI